MIFGHALNKEELLEEKAREDEANEVGSYLSIIIQHLLKYKYQKEKQSSSWADSMKANQRHIDKLLDNTNVRNRAGTKSSLDKDYKNAYDDAMHDIEKSGRKIDLPKERPEEFTLDNLVNKDWRNKYIEDNKGDSWMFNKKDNTKK